MVNRHSSYDKQSGVRRLVYVLLFPVTAGINRMDEGELLVN